MPRQLDVPRIPQGHRAVLALLLVTAVVVACGDGSTVPENPSIVGRWSGTAVLGAVRFQATFTQDGDRVGGSGHFTSPLGSGPFTVDGRLTGADVALALTSNDFGATTYRGRFTSADRIEGRLEAPEYSAIELVLERD